MSRLLICLLIVLMFGCAKVYDCDKYTDLACTYPLGMESYIVQPGSNESEAQAMCMEDEFTWSGPYFGETVVEDTTFTMYPKCCNCSFDNYSSWLIY